MSRLIDIDRISIALHGISATVAEAAVEELDEELRRRLGHLVERALISGDLGMVHVTAVSGEAPLDAASLRGLIAERLVFALSTPVATTEAPEREEPQHPEEEEQEGEE